MILFLGVIIVEAVENQATTEISEIDFLQKQIQPQSMTIFSSNYNRGVMRLTLS